MKIYILIDFDGEIEGVYSTKDKALKRKNVLPHTWQWGIEEWVVN